MVMKKVSLLGDLIFDNENGAPGQSVLEQINKNSKKNWTVELVAQENAGTRDIAKQCKRISKNTTHLIVSCGGTDALKHIDVIRKPVSNMLEAMESATMVRSEFQKNYRTMLSKLQKQGKNMAVCTIFIAPIKLPASFFTALILFNDIITTEAFIVPR